MTRADAGGPAGGPQPPAYPISSVDNVLRLLKLLGGQDALTLTEVSHALGVAPSTAHRLLAMLRYHDFVRQDPHTRAYRPGRALLEIALAAAGAPFPGWLDVRALARTELEALSRRVEETVHLVMLDGGTAFFLASVECRRTVRVTSRAGAAMPAHCTASGKVLLARLAAGELRGRLGPDPLPGLTPRSLTTLDTLREQLRAVREAGYATNFGESEDGLSAVAVAVPVKSSLGMTLSKVATLGDLSVTVSTPSGRLDPGRAPGLAAAAAETAARIAERLARAAAATRGEATLRGGS